MASSWRQFNLFKSQQVKDADDDSLAGPSIFSSQSSAHILATYRDFVFVGAQDGTIQALDQQFRVVGKVKAYDGGQVSQILACEDNLVVSIGDEGNEGPVLKSWALRTSKGNDYAFKHLSTLVMHSDKPFPITCCTALKDLSHVAVGFSDGRVLLVKGDLARDRGAKQRTIYEGEEPITGLEFMVDDKAVTLYIFSTSKMLTLVITNSTGKSVTQIPRIMESVGAALGCITLDRKKNEIVVVRKDALYLYGVEGRGPCYALEGRKSSVDIFDGYAIVDQSPDEAKNGTVKVLGKLGIPTNTDEASRITIFDTANKFIAHIGYFSQGIRKVFAAWSAIHVLAMDGCLYRLSEIDMEEKLDILYNKNSYTLALNLAKEARFDDSRMGKIRIHYADYLYKKGNFQPAVQQYILAINQCDISSVMRKYLEAQHVPLLTEFLEALHTAKKSNADYSTLLLNCYAKLKQKDKLQKFLRDDSDRPIDLEVAVALCRQAGYYDQAISLSSRRKNHAISLGIMIEDKKDHKAALTYITKLRDLEEVALILQHFGRPLMTALPAETTRLFINVYTGSFVPESTVQASGIMSPPRKASAVYGGAFYDSIMNNKYSQALPSLPALDMSQFNPMRRVASSSPSLSTKEVANEPLSAAASTMAAEGATHIKIPSPRTAFPIFVDFPSEFIHFLEVILERQTFREDSDDRKLVVSTLLELYLKQASSATDDEKQAIVQDKAKALLTSESENIDTSNALLLFHLSSFREGSILMQERAGRKEDVFRSYCTLGDTASVIKFLHLHAEADPHLYPLALKYFSSSSKAISEAGTELSFVLRKIHEKRLMAPLQVIQALSANSSATIGIVKDYLSEIITKERAEIDKHQSLIDSYKRETEAKVQERRDLSENARVIQVTRCSRCGGTLALPVLHFLCKHSFHQRCVETSSSNEANSGTALQSSSKTTSTNGDMYGDGLGGDGGQPECPLCADSTRALRSAVKHKKDLSAQQEFLRDGLSASRDKPAFLFSRLDLTSELH